MFPINYGTGTYNGNDRGASWLSMILPQIDQAALFGQIRFGAPADDQLNVDAATTPIPLYMCPADVHGNGVMENRRNASGPRAITNFKQPSVDGPTSAEASRSQDRWS